MARRNERPPASCGAAVVGDQLSVEKRLPMWGGRRRRSVDGGRARVVPENPLILPDRNQHGITGYSRLAYCASASAGRGSCRLAGRTRRGGSRLWGLPERRPSFSCSPVSSGSTPGLSLVSATGQVWRYRRSANAISPLGPDPGGRIAPWSPRAGAAPPSGVCRWVGRFNPAIPASESPRRLCCSSGTGRWLSAIGVMAAGFLLLP